jgi:hypothetical protein
LFEIVACGNEIIGGYIVDLKSAMVVFKGKHIRRKLHNDQWYFAVIDVVKATTDSVDARDYRHILKK